ncbi:hypothetical protein ACET3Z_022978 [Daucus carota]
MCVSVQRKPSDKWLQIKDCCETEEWVPNEGGVLESLRVHGCTTGQKGHQFGDRYGWLNGHETSRKRKNAE